MFNILKQHHTQKTLQRIQNASKISTAKKKIPVYKLLN
jgi:hypothetical protein